MKKIINGLKILMMTLGVIFILIIGSILCFAAYNKFIKTEENAAYHQHTVSTVLDIDFIISQIGELNASKEDYTLSHRYDKSKQVWGHSVPFTSNYVTLQYSGVVKAGIDLNKLRIKSTEKSVSIKLPEAEIFSNDLDTESFKILDEKKNIFNHINVEEFNLCYDTMKKEGEAKAIREGILEEAKTSAESHIRFMLSDICEKNNVELIIE